MDRPGTSKYIVVFLFCFGSLNAQDRSWNSVYNFLKESLAVSNYQVVVSRAESALQLASDQFGELSEPYAETLRIQMLAYYNLEEYTMALRLAEKELKVREAIDTTRSTHYLEALKNLSVIYHQLNNYNRADSLLAEHVQNSRSLLNNSVSTSYIENIYQLAMLKNRSGEVRQAQRLYQEVIYYHEKAGLITDQYANSLYHKALPALDSPRSALPLLQESVNVHRKLGNTNLPAYLKPLYSLGLARMQTGNDEQATVIFQEVKTLAGKLGMETYQASAWNNLGTLAFRNGQIEDAVYFFQESFNIREAKLDSLHEDLVVAVNNLAGSYYASGRKKEARALYEQWAALGKDRSVTNIPWQFGSLLSQYAQICWEEYQYNRADRFFSQALAIYDVHLADEPALKLYKASTHYFAAINYQSQGQFDFALLSLQSAEQLIREAEGTNNENFLSVKVAFATLFQEKGEYRQAERYFNQALELQESLSGRNTNAYAGILNNYALMSQEIGNYIKAERMFRECLTIKANRVGTDNPNYSIVQSNLGLLYLEMGAYNEAESMLLQALETHRSHLGSKHPVVASSLINVGRLEQTKGNYTRAEPFFQEALAIRSSTYGNNHPAYATAINNMALLYQTMGNYESAEPLMRKTRNILKRYLGVNHPQYATVTQNLATLYQIQGKTNLGGQYLEEAVAIDREVLGENHPAYASSLNNLASYYQNLARYDSARMLYEQSAAIIARNFGTNHPVYLSTRFNLGSLYLELGNNQQAYEILTEVRKGRAKIFGRRHPDFAQSLYSLAILQTREQNYQEAYLLFKQVVDSYLYQINSFFPALSEKEKSAFYLRIKPFLKSFEFFVLELHRQQTTYPTLYRNAVGELYNLQLYTKALLLNTSNRLRQRILSSGNEEAIELYNNWIAKKEYLVRMFTLSRSQLSERNINLQELEAEINQLEKVLSEKSASFAREIDQDRPNWKAVRATLQKGEAAIEVVRTFSDFEKENVAYIAFTLHPGAEHPALTVMNNGDYLEGRGFKYLYNAILYKIKDNRSYGSYWEPIKHSIPPETRVIYFSADGVYNLINPNTLFNEATNQYIIEEYNIRLLSSTRELLDGAESGNPTNSAVLMGYPDYATDTAEQQKNSPLLNPDNMIIADTVVNPLPGTAAEVDTLNQILSAYNWHTSVYTRHQATEEQIKQVNSPKLLHIATHGYFLQDVEVNDQEKAYGIHIQNVKANPLLRSGLLLAGAQNTINGSLLDADSVTEDGILTAYEAMNLNLDETEMVVMSACETGLGEVRNGEGVYGLQRAFMVAGAKSVIMSLWKVDDETTQELMRIFYSRWMSGENKLAAFYNAQIELKAKFKDPLYWGGFVMLGL